MKIKEKIMEKKDKAAVWIKDNANGIGEVCLWVSGVCCGIIAMSIFGKKLDEETLQFFKTISEGIPKGVPYTSFWETNSSRLKHPMFFVISDEDLECGNDHDFIEEIGNS